MIGLLLMMLVITADVIARRIFGQSLSWVYGLTESFLMVIVVFLGIAYTHYKDDHIRFKLIIDIIPKTGLKIITAISHLFTMLFFVLIAYQGLLQTLHAWEKDISTGGIVSLPLYLSYIWVPLGSILVIIISCLRIWENVKEIMSPERYKENT